MCLQHNRHVRSYGQNENGEHVHMHKHVRTNVAGHWQWPLIGFMIKNYWLAVYNYRPN